MFKNSEKSLIYTLNCKQEVGVAFTLRGNRINNDDYIFPDCTSIPDFVEKENRKKYSSYDMVRSSIREFEIHTRKYHESILAFDGLGADSLTEDTDKGQNYRALNFLDIPVAEDVIRV